MRDEADTGLDGHSPHSAGDPTHGFTLTKCWLCGLLPCIPTGGVHGHWRDRKLANRMKVTRWPVNRSGMAIHFLCQRRMFTFNNPCRKV